MVENFCEKLKVRLAGIPDSEDDKALVSVLLHELSIHLTTGLQEWPLCEYGYSKRPVSRLKDHIKHTNSNYVMNLFEAVASVVYPSQFEIKQYILYLIPSPTVKELAEMFITAVGHGMIYHGGGFSHAAAGRNNHCDLTALEWYNAFEVVDSIVHIDGNYQLYRRATQHRIARLKDEVADWERRHELDEEFKRGVAKFAATAEVLPAEQGFMDSLRGKSAALEELLERMKADPRLAGL